MSLDRSEKLSFLYTGLLFPDGIYISDVELKPSKDVYLTRVNGVGDRIDDVLLGSILPIVVPENQIENIVLLPNNALTVTTTLGTLTFDDFVSGYVWEYPESTGVGFKIADQNNFKPLVSVHNDFIVTELENGDVRLEVVRDSETGESIGNSNLIELSVIRYSSAIGFSRVITNPANEVDGTYKKIPFNYATEIPGLFLDETGSFKLPSGRYYLDFVINVRAGRRSKVALFEDVSGRILLHGVGNYNTASAGIGIGSVSIRGFVDVTKDEFMSLRVLGYDLGTYYSPDTDVEAPIVVHRANIFKLAGLPNTTPNLLTFSTFGNGPIYRYMNDYEQYNQITNSSSINSGTFPPWKAFAKGTPTAGTDGWISLTKPTVANPQWVEISFQDGPKPLKRYSIQNRAGTAAGTVAAPTDFELWGRNNTSESWTVLHTVTGNADVGIGSVHEYEINDSDAYSIYRVNVTASHGTSNYVCIARLRIWSTSNPIVTVPMTSYENATQLVTRSTENTATFAAWKAFDGVALADPNDSWASLGNPSEAVPQWLELKFKNGPKQITHLTLINRTISTLTFVAAPVDFELWGRNLETDNWVVCLSVKNNVITASGATHRYSLPEPVSYSSYRLNITKAVAGATYTCVAQMILSDVEEYVGASSHQGIYIPDNVVEFEDNQQFRTTADCWLSAGNRSEEAEYLKFHFGNAAVVNGLLLQGRQDAGTATTVTVDPTLSRDFVFQAYDTTLNEWVDLYTSPDESVFSISGKYYYTFDNSNAYVDYRLWFKPLTESTQTFQQRSIGRIELYGARL